MAFHTSHFLHGGDYNPDQWMDRYPEILDEDMRLMHKAGVNVTSVGIFSWVRYEPSEGEFHFEWMDQLLDRLHHNNIKAFLATPSGSKPAWMSRQYPEVCRVDARGRRDHHARRHNHCWSSPVYRRKVADLNQRLAARYMDHPAVLLWHLSNEYNGECHCPLCYESFRQWLRQRYQSLEELNHAWWSEFWSHRITDWELIDPRDHSIDGLRLDWHRFVTDQTVDFLKAEVAALRKGGAQQPVTTNMMGTFPHLDYWKIAPYLDVIADDAYPTWKYHDQQDRTTAAHTAFLHDMHRSMKGGQPWLLMESCPDTVQWAPVPKRKRPGVYRNEMLLAVAHGADSVCYFQWRKGRGGMEKFHGAVVDHEGSENTRVFQQVAELGQTLHHLPQIPGTTTPAETAIIFDWEVRWAMQTSDGPSRIDKGDPYLAPVLDLHHAFWNHGIPTDVLQSTADFSGYRLLLAPQLFLLLPGVAEALHSFVHKGGTLLLTQLSGVVNESNLTFLGGFPGNGLRQWTGVWAEEVDYLYPEDSQSLQFNNTSDFPLRGNFPTGPVVESLRAEDAETLATFQNDFLASKPAFTRRRLGSGQVFYLAARMPVSFYHQLAEAFRSSLGLRRSLETHLPEGVAASHRTDGNHDFVFLQNFTQRPHQIQLDQDDYTCLESEQRLPEGLHLPPWSTRLLQRPAR